MKNFTSCICILGLSGMAFGDVMIDQIGADDGTGIGTNITGNQDFEAAYDIYDIVTVDNFTGAGENIAMVEMVLNGWNGFVDPSSVVGYTANIYADSASIAASTTGDIASEYIDAADASMSGTWAGGGFLMSVNTAMMAGSGDQLIGLQPANDFATGGQTGTADSVSGDGVSAWQGNPGGGFGMPGNAQETGSDAAYRVSSDGIADPCDSDLGFCPADIDANGAVNVDDLLIVMGNWGQAGDGTFRPQGDIYPEPSGDCMVNVDDLLAMMGAFGAECIIEGGCCLGDGTCSVDTPANCAANGGTYFGDDSTCADGACAAAACCIDSATCADLTEDACDAMGGTYKGDGTSCAGTDCAAIEAGDECDVAIAVVDGANAFDTTNMTAGGSTPDDMMCDGTFLDWGASQDGWYSYVATGGITNFTTCDAASYDTSMVLYEGTCDNQVACNGDSVANDGTGCQAYYSEIDFDCVAGTTYYVRIGAWNGDGAGPGTLTITPPVTGNGACCMTDGSCIDGMDAADCVAFGGSFAGVDTLCADDPCAAGAGDECDTAVEIFEGANAFDTSVMTPSYPIPDDTLCAGTYLDWGDSPDGWYAWTSTGTGTASFSACDAASYDTSMALYEGTCDNQVSCNGDTGGEDGCQAYYSAVYDWPVTEGTVYIVRMGGWNGDSGAGTITVTFTGANAMAACCIAGACSDLTAVDCDAAGGVWLNGSTCADAACYQGCPAGAEADCDDCAQDGDDSSLDCNAGLNGPTGTEFQAITMGTPICGTASVFVDGPTGGTYRDLDWFTNATLNAGGDFVISAGTSGEDLLFGVVDNAAGAFVAAYMIPGGTEGSAEFLALPAGDYSILVGPNEWNTAWTCASGLVDYWVQLD